MAIKRALFLGMICGGLLACAGEDGPTGPAGENGANGANGANGTDGKSSLVAVTAEPPGANCANGGQRIETGIDDDNSGTLEPGEVDSTSYVCAGDPGAGSLVNVTAEPAGANCADGGQRIDTGVDDNRNGTLEAGEVDDTSFVCNGDDGTTTLITVTAEPPGANCPAGGQRIVAGLDDNGNGTLEAAEIDETAFVCNGRDGQSSSIPPNAVLWLRMDDDPTDGAIDSAGAHTTTCPSGACPVLVNAQNGTGYQFTADRLTTAGAANLQPGTAFTVAAWVRLDSTPTENDVIVTCKLFTGPDCSYGILVSTARQITWYHQGGGRLVSTTALTVGQWTHVAYTWDGTTKRGYINGVLNGSQAMASPGSNATDGLTFGHYTSTIPLFLPGSLDQAVFYNRVLTQAELTSLATP